MATIVRETTESKITVSLQPPPLAQDYRQGLNTPIQFLNHMLEHIAWRSRLNISVAIELAKFELSHVVCEDLGQTLGRAVGQLIKGGFGCGHGIIDEARAFCALSFEDRVGFFFDQKVEMAQEVEGMSSEDLKVFLEGFTQGARCTMQIEVSRGDNMHHIWEAVFRALGTALGESLNKGHFSGVAGNVAYRMEDGDGA